MDLHQLQVFSKVVEHKSFSKAAEALYLSQSTVSSHIQSLEKTLNVTLFDRVGRETILTPYGERLYYWAQKLLLLRDEAILDINQSTTELKGVIQIGVSSVPGQFILPKLLKDFRINNPSVTFSINESASKTVAEKVMNGTVDLGILGEKYENNKLSYVPLLNERLVLIASPEFSFQPPIAVSELIKYPLVMRNANSGTRALIERFLRKKGIKDAQLNIVAHTNSSQGLIELVKHGIGISIISEIGAKEQCSDQRIKVFEIEDFDEERYFYLVYNKDKTLSMAARLLIQKISENHQI